MAKLIFVTTKTSFDEKEAHIVVQELTCNITKEFRVPLCNCACAVEYATLTAIEMANEMQSKDIIIVHNKDNQNTKDIEKFFEPLVGKVEFLYVRDDFFDPFDTPQEMVQKVQNIIYQTNEILAKEAYWYLLELNDTDMLKTVYLFITDDFTKDVILKLINQDNKIYTKPQKIDTLNVIYNLLSDEYQDRFIKLINSFFSREDILLITQAHNSEYYFDFFTSLKDIGKVFFKTMKQKRERY